MTKSEPITEYSKLYDKYSKENDYRQVPFIDNEWILVKDQWVAWIMFNVISFYLFIHAG